MANLRLKQESYRRARETVGFAAVMVDHGIFHLDYLFDYAIPADLAEHIAIGSRVQVSFRGIRREGIVYEIKSSPEKAGRHLAIEKLLGHQPLISAATISLVTEVARNWATHPYDIWRSALPSRIISVEKEQKVVEPSSAVLIPTKPLRATCSYLFLPPARSEYTLIGEVVAGYLARGNVLVIFPDDKDIERFTQSSGISNIINLGSGQSKADRYRSYLTLSLARSSVIVGNRSAIFAHIPDLAAIVIHREISENHYEARTPGWNTRDVALIRCTSEKVPLVFTGYGPSSEMARLIDTREVVFSATRFSLKISALPPIQGELLPNGVISLIKKSAKDGNVLILVPRKGYASGLLCSRCRSVVHHRCGGVLTRTSIQAPMICSMCNQSVPEIECPWCHSTSFSITGRGSARIAEEIGRAIPNITIRESTAEKMIESADGGPGITIATSGAQPQSFKGYDGVFIVDAERFLAGIDLRAQERSEESFFATMALGKVDAIRGISLPQAHPVVASLNRWSPALVAKRELQEREAAGLPPFTHVIEIGATSSELVTLESGFLKARAEGRLPARVQVARGKEKIRLYTPREDAHHTTTFVHELARKRSVSGKKMFSLRINPYSLQ